MLRSLHNSFASSIVINLLIHAFRGSSCFLHDLTPVSLILCFRWSTEVSLYLFHHIFFCHAFITHSFDVPKPAEHANLHYHRDIIASTCYFVYLIRDRISTAFTLPSFFFCNTHISRSNTALCTAIIVAVLTLRRLINAAKTSLSLLPAKRRFSASISFLPSLLNILPIWEVCIQTQY